MAIRKLASEFLCSPARVVVGSQDLAASHSVRQVVEVIDGAARDARLHALLQQYHGSRRNRVIVFVLYKKEAARVESLLQRKGWKAAAVHGDISQAQRSAAVDAFKAGTVPVLVATDVAARGLDIPDVEVVINYSFPLTTEDYVHRIGRTGRAGKSGALPGVGIGREGDCPACRRARRPVLVLSWGCQTQACRGGSHAPPALASPEPPTAPDRPDVLARASGFDAPSPFPHAGLAHTMFVGLNDKPRAGELINVLKEAGQEVPDELYKFGTTVKKKESKLYGAHFKDVDLTKKATKISFDSDDE